MKRIRIILILFTVLLFFLAIAAGVIYTKNIRRNIIEGIEKELKSIAELKANGLSDWYIDELNDVEYIAQDKILIRSISRLLANKNEANEQFLSDYLSAIATQHDYSNIVLFDTNAQLVYAHSELSNSHRFDSLINKTIAVEQEQALVICKNQDEKNALTIDLSVPILDVNQDLIGILLFTIKPKKSFFYTFENWPARGESGKVILFVKNANDVIFINNTGSLESDSLVIKISLDQNDCVAVQGVSDHLGFIEGKDYRGNSVLAYTKNVEDTNWFVMVKIDKKEVFSSFKTKVRVFYLILILFLPLLFIVIIYFHRTSQSKLYNKLFLANEEYRTTLYSIGDAVITTDTEGRVKNINAIAQKLTGWNATDALNRPIEEVFRIVNEDNHERVESPFKKIIESGVVVGLTNHTLLISKDNVYRHIVDSGAPIFDRNGKLSGIVIVFRDQTSQREQENKIKEQSRQMQTLLSNLPGMAYRCQPDKNWTMNFVSSGCLLLTGYWNHELVDNRKVSYNSLILPQYRDKVRFTVDEFLSENKNFELEYEIKTKSGEIKWVWEKGRAIYDDYGKVYAIEGLISDVSERIRVGQELEASRSLFKNLASNASVGIFKTDIEGNTVYVNSKWCEIVGCTEHEALGMQWLKRLHPDDREDVHNNWLKVVGGTEGYATEYRFLHDNNKLIWVQGQVAPEFDEKQNIIGYVGTITDITKRVLAEQALKHTNNLLYTIIEHIPDKIYMKDAQGRKVIANRNDVLDCGAESFEEIEGKTDFELFPKEIAEKYWADDQLVLKDGKAIINKKEHLITKNGREEWVRTSKIPLKNEQGEIVGLVGLGHDITNQVRAEKEHIKLSAALEQTPLNIIITDTDGFIEYVNHNFINTTGYTFDEVLGEKPNILKSGIHSKELYAEMWSMLTRGYDWRGELQNKKKNGELFWVNAVITPVKNELNEVINYVAIEEDITYKNELFDELLGAKNKAEESDKLKTSFLANMSHEIRTPLNSIIGFTDLLKDAETLSLNERKEFSSIIEKSAESLLQIINDIIDISSLETNQMSICKSTFSLNSMIDALHREYISLSQKSPHNIEIRKLPMDVQLDITNDKNRLNQIFVNLLNNALKFTSEGYIEFGVIKHDERYIYFKVADTGIGISEAYQEAIFDRFRQVESSMTRKFGGNGLGLSIVKNLIGLMGGDITLESEVGKGSCFSFYLPK